MGSLIIPREIPNNIFLDWLHDNVRIEFHYSDKKYLTDVISENEIRNEWTPASPVFISSQTGTRKTTLIWNKLIEAMFKENPHSKHRLLLLSNRTALYRNFREKLERLAIEYGITSHIGDDEKYTPSGKDEDCHEYGPIDIYLYQQLGAVKDFSHYDYIVCDECHFFTSDSRINRWTGTILRKIIKQGRNAVRIYMSATPEVAFEPIVRDEFEFMDTSPNDGHLSIQFYYLKRDYLYIQNIFAYDNKNSLIPIIKESVQQGNKWLIFTHSKETGFDIEKELHEADISCVFVSSDSKKSEKEDGKAFSTIIKVEHFEQNVLISTSVLDNGISILDEKIQDIAILDIYDRTEFVQMLGRLRLPNDDTKINLHILKLKLNSLKNEAKIEATNLINRLSIDIKPETEVSQLFNSASSPYYDDDMFGHSSMKVWYNACAIYQILTVLAETIQLIRVNEPDYCIKFENNDFREATKANLLSYYVNKGNENSGWEKPWSRIVVDVLSSQKDLARYNKLQVKDMMNGLDNEYYQSKINATFLNYLFNHLIKEQLVGHLQTEFEQYLSSLDIKYQNYFRVLLKLAERNNSEQDKPKLSLSKSISIVCKDQIFEELSEDIKTKLKRFQARAEAAEKEVRRYKSLMKNTGDPIIEQLKWIEKDKQDLKPVCGSIWDDLENCKNYIEFITKRSVTVEQVENAKSKNAKSSNTKWYETSFLSQYGVHVSKDNNPPTKEEAAVNDHYFKGSSFKEEKGKLYPLDGNENIVIEVKLYPAKGKTHEPYYLFVKRASSNSEDDK